MHAKLRQAGFMGTKTQGNGLNCKVASSTASLEEIFSLYQLVAPV